MRIVLFKTITHIEIGEVIQLPLGKFFQIYPCMSGFHPDILARGDKMLYVWGGGGRCVVRVLKEKPQGMLPQKIFEKWIT